ncbi:LuxR C-terminal-related transcriptional regulator [Chloroflexota bacterium]
MTIQILATKLYRPATRIKRVRRERLIERLESGLNGKLTLVSAPAGFGKTTLVSDWAGQSKRGVAWLSLDEGDNDLARFLAYLVAAVQTIEISPAGDTPLGAASARVIQSPQLPPVETVLTGLINEIAGAPTDLILCLDDYHLIQNSAIHEALTFFLEYLPENIHLVLVSRADPPLPLARWRGRGLVNEIRAADLRFSTDEAAEFLNQVIGLRLPEQYSASLAEYTEGWITGLQLAGLSMQKLDPQGNAQFIENFSGRYHIILDYLVDEVISQQPEAIQRFLAQTSILERMSGPLCDAVLKTGLRSCDEQAGLDSQDVLRKLHQENMFIDPLDAEHYWFRYHQLFGQLLRSRLIESCPELVLELHRRAAEWFETNKLMPEAISHALATMDFDFAADVIHRATLITTTWTSAGVASLQGWLAALPEATVRERPWLRLFESRALCATSQWEPGKRILDELKKEAAGQLKKNIQAAQKTADSERLYRAILADQASIAAVQGQVRQAIRYTQDSLANLPAEDLGMRLRLLVVQGMAQTRAGQVTEAGQNYSRAIQLAQEAGIAFAAVPFACNLADSQFTQGQLNLSYQTCQDAIQMGIINGQPNPISGYVGLALAKIYYERNRLEEAEEHILQGLDLLTSGGNADSFGTIHSELARIKGARGDFEGAQQAIHFALQIANGCNIPRLTALTAAFQANIWLAQGHNQRAALWADEYRQIGESEYLREFEDLTLARVLYRLGRPRETLSVLGKLLTPAETAGRFGTVIYIQAWRALALQACGKPDDALTALARALELAQPEGYLRVFLEGGQAMQELLKLAGGQGFESGFILELLDAFEGAPAGLTDGETPSPADLSAPTSTEALIETLTDRETQVLHLLAQGLSNAEIGQRLYISLPTVKSHTSNIYGKLGVRRRKQAVVKARALGLMPR